MAAKKKTSARAKKADPTQIVVRYDLFDLPTAQHKAGLAGLIFLIKHLNETGPEKEKIQVGYDGPAAVSVTFTPDNLVRLFNSLYDARFAEAKSESKWKGATELRIEEPPGGKKLFVYQVVQPKGDALARCYPDGDAPNSAWLALWRRMLWEIPRGKPTTRKPFQDRADGKVCSEGASAWKDLIKYEDKRQKNQFHTAEVSSAILLGAQAKNAEQVPFLGRVEQNLLLHFWTLTSLIFVPEVVDADGKRKFVGYVLAIPEVSHLEQFVSHYPRLLNNLSPQRRWARPAQAIVELPEQGVLDFMEHLASVSSETVEERSAGLGVRSVDFFYMVKQGNNVKTQSSGSFAVGQRKLEEYRSICGTFRNPLFIFARLRSLLDERKWYARFEELFSNREATLFLHGAGANSLPALFIRDVQTKFRQIERDEILRKEMRTLMSENAAEVRGRDLATIVRSLIQRYIDYASLLKLGCDIKKDDGARRAAEFRKTKDYDEKKRNVSEDLFLNFRSRRGQDFVDYFVSRIGAASQFLPEGDYATLSAALLNQAEAEDVENWRDVKTLAMLAIPSVSWIRTRNEEN